MGINGGIAMSYINVDPKYKISPEYLKGLQDGIEIALYCRNRNSDKWQETLEKVHGTIIEAKMSWIENHILYLSLKELRRKEHEA